MAADKTTANLTDGTYNFDILCYKIEHDIVKDVIILPIPKTESAINKTPITNVKNPLVWNIDLTQVKQVITLTGYLLEETSSPALTKKDQLEAMASTASLVTLTWKVGTTTITKYGSLLKTKVSEVPLLIGDEHPSTQRKAFPIMLQFAVGNFRS